MDRPVGLGALQSGQWQQLQEYAGRFARAWQSLEGEAETVDLGQFLPPGDDPLRPAVLHELIKTDLEVRWRRGLGLDLEQYVVWFPELGPVKTLAPQLIYEEYRVRRAYGDQPALASYEARFPEQFADLRRLVHDHPSPTMSAAAPAQSTPAGVRSTDSPSVRPTRGASPSVSSDPTPAKTVAASKAPQVVEVGGGYALVKFLGRGGFGEVWRAEAPGGIPVAIKIINRPLDNEESQRELHSLELIKRLRHPFLLQTQAFFPKEDRLYIIMELADGSLRDRLKECRHARLPGIPAAELVRYFKEAAEALDYLHSEKVLHRDIKPDNILLLKRHAKVADFGLARLAESSRMMSASGSGTPAFMAPEIWRGKVGEHSDQYSLAIAYAELRLDRRLFDAGDMMALMLAHVHTTPDLSPLGEAEQQVFLKALAKEPDQRFSNCVEFAQALEEALAGELGRTSPELGGTGRPGRRPSSGPETDMAEPNRNAAVSREPGLKDLDFKSLAGEHLELVVPNRNLPSVLGPPAIPVPEPKEDWRQPPPPPVLPQNRRWLLPALAGFAALAIILPGVWWLSGRSLIGQNNQKGSGNQMGDNADVVKLPFNCVPAPGAEVRTLDGKNYFSEIEYQLDDLRPIPFLLIWKGKGTDPDTFYMMKNKVSVQQFNLFATLFPDQIKDSRWKEGALAAGKALRMTNDRLPVMNVSVGDALRFALWLRGDLPTVHQWNKASGFYEEPRAGEGPFEGTWDGKKADPVDVAVRRGKEGPLPVGEAKRDVSPFGCHDMAGNGEEWTRDLFANVSNRRVTPNFEAKPFDAVTLRGRRYDEPRPLFYTDMANAQKSAAWDYINVSPYIGFRVVIEPKP